MIVFAVLWCNSRVSCTGLHAHHMYSLTHSSPDMGMVPLSTFSATYIGTLTSAMAHPLHGLTPLETPGLPTISSRASSSCTTERRVPTDVCAITNLWPGDIFSRYWEKDESRNRKPFLGFVYTTISAFHMSFCIPICMLFWCVFQWVPVHLYFHLDSVYSGTFQCIYMHFHALRMKKMHLYFCWKHWNGEH